MLGIKGISSPICHKTELVADFLEEPVPTTSPTKATGKPFSFNLFIVSIGSVIPSRGILYIAKACKGMSGLDQASGAGERSSVFVSPGTLKILAFINFGVSGLDVNHSASAQETKIFLALGDFFDNSAMSLKASKISKVLDNASTAISPHSSSSISSINGSTL